MRREGEPRHGERRHDERISVARSISAVEQLESVWRRFSWSRIDCDFEYFLTVTRARAAALRPHVVVVRRGEEPVAMALARVESTRLTTRVGYRAVHRPAVQAITVAPGGIAATDGAAARSAITALRDALVRREADLAIVSAVTSGSTVAAAARAAANRRTTGHISRVTIHRRLRLPADPELFLTWLPRNFARTIQQAERRLREIAGAPVSVRCYQDSSDLEHVLADMEYVAGRTYQRALGVAFTDRAEERELIRLGLSRGAFRAYVLVIGAEPVAYWYGTIYRSTLFLRGTGYDPSRRYLSLGKVLFARMATDVCADPSVDVIDFGFGDADYKRRFGNESWYEEDVLLFAPTARAIRINLTRAAVVTSADVARRVLARTDREQRVKTHWRSRLAASNHSAAVPTMPQAPTSAPATRTP